MRAICTQLKGNQTWSCDIYAPSGKYQEHGKARFINGSNVEVRIEPGKYAYVDMRGDVCTFKTNKSRGQFLQCK